MSHELLDEISLELGRRTAARLRQQPDLIHVARENLSRWANQNSKSPALLRCYAEWQALLDQPLEALCAVLTSDNEEGRRLRQNSPFAGVLTPSEVWEVKRQFRHAATTT